MTMEEERKLPRRARPASGALNSSGTEEEEEEESGRPSAAGAESDSDDEDESDYSESDEDLDAEKRAEGAGGSLSIKVPSSNKAISENDARDSIRERLKIGRIDLSLVKEPTTVAGPLPTVVVAGEGEMADICKAVMPDDAQTTTKNQQDNTEGKPVKKETARGLKKKKERPSRDRLQDPHAPLYSAQRYFCATV
jgi:hypothetical protein